VGASYECWGLSSTGIQRPASFIHHRATGTRLLSEPGTPAFLVELAALNETIQT